MKKNILKRRDYIWMYLMLLFLYGFYFCGENSIITTSILWISILCITYNKKCLKKIIVIYLLVTLILVVSGMVNGYSLRELVYNISGVTLAFVFINAYSLDDFSRLYTKVLFVLAVFSLVLHILFSLNSSIIKLGMPLVNTKGVVGYFWLGSTVTIPINGELRNAGIFWEPGAFQFFLVLAFILQLYSDKKKKKYLIIYLITLYTTLSTTGLFCLILLVILWVSETKKINQNTTIVLMIVFVSLGLVYFYSIKSNSYLYYTIFAKTEGLLNLILGRGSETGGSDLVRFESIYYPLKALLKSPIIGVGFNGYNKITQELGHSMMTCTWVNWFSYYGILMGAVFVCGIWKFVGKISEKFSIKSYLFVLLFISIFSEAFNISMIITLLVFYGYSEFGLKDINNEKNFIINKYN